MKELARLVSPLSRSGAARNQRRALATRDVLPASKGSGAPSRRARIGVLAFAAALLLVALLAVPASASKTVVDLFGTTGFAGGQFQETEGVAVNSSGIGPADAGDIYVADARSFEFIASRIQRLDSSGKFLSAWGANEIHRNEVQRVAPKADGGTYTLTFDGSTTTPIAFNAGSGTVDNALDVLPSIGGDANVNVRFEFFNSGDPLLVTFTGALAGTDVPQLTANTGGLVGVPPIVKIETVENGSGGGGTNYEICTVASTCGGGATSGGNGTTAGNGVLNSPTGIAVDGDTGNVYVSDRNNFRINEYDGVGNFIRSFGWDVVASGVDNGAEFQRVAVDATGGTFTLSFGSTPPTTTSAIPSGATPTEVRTALEALGDIAVGDVRVSGPTGGPWTVRFIATLGNLNQPNLGIDPGLLTGDNPAVPGAGPGGAVTETVAGGGANYEICEAGTTDVCKAGVAGSGAGQIGSAESGALGVAISTPDGSAATGTLFLADTQNRRVSTYALDGTEPASFGSASTFATGQPSKIAVDSRGIVYASNTNNGAEIERYDSQNANGGGAVFLAPILPSVNEEQTLAFTGFQSTFNDYFTLTCPNGSTTKKIWYSNGLFGSTLIQEALEEKCGVGNTFTSGEPPNTAKVTYQGSFAATDVPPMVCTTVDGAGSCSVTAEVNGHTGALIPNTQFPASATRGLAVDRDSDGGGPDTDVLYVTRRPILGNGGTAIQQFGPVNKPGLVAAPSTADDTHGSSVGFTFTSDLALNDQTGRLFVSSNFGTSDSSFGGRGVYVLDDPGSLPAIGAVVVPVTVKGDTTATFSGQVNPAGGAASCKFEYSTDQLAWTVVPEPDCRSLNSGGGYQAISQSVTGLVPNTHYFVRLSASRTFIANSTVTSNVTAFDTDLTPPVLAAVGAVQVADISARLVGSIDPRHSATAYVFQYGTTPGFESSTETLAIGDGASPIGVSQVISNLTPDTTYYFRLVATNLAGTTTSAGKTLHTRTDPFPLPEDRRWEMVTPPDKNLSSTDQGPLTYAQAGASRDGQSVAFCAGSFGEPTGQVPYECAPYISRRTPGGWQTTNPFPRICRLDLGGSGVPNELGVDLAPNFDRAAITLGESASCAIPPIDPAAPLVPGKVTGNLYQEDFTTDPPSYQLLAPQAGAHQYIGGSDDFSHVFYLSRVNQTPYPGDSPEPGTFLKIYDSHNGSLSLISRKPNNEPFTTNSSLAGPEGNTLGEAVSADGERIYFQNPSTLNSDCSVSGCEIYLREGGTTTYDVSATECTVSCGSPDEVDRFDWASPSGDKALFYSCAKLTDASAPTVSCGAFLGISGTPGVKLYRWDSGAPSGHHLIDLSADHEPADGTQSTYAGTLGASDDGDTVYFVANSQLVSGQPTAPGAKVYRWRWNGGNPDLEYLGSFDQPYVGSSDNWRHFSANWLFRHQQVTPDGKYLMIQTTTALDPVADRDSDVDIYRWSEGDGWICLSCQLPGVPSAGDANENAHFGGGSGRLHWTKPLSSKERVVTMSEDGQRVFFQTPDALVPEDVNGEAGCPVIFGSGIDVKYACSDIYEWHDGTVSLISSGTGAEDSYLLGTSPSGDDVFFFTRDRLVGWDLDSGVDIYNARVGGGFPEPLPQPPICEGEACRGEGTGAPNVPGAGTAVFEGPGNQPKSLDKKRKRCKSGFVRRGGKCVKRNNKRAQHRAANNNRRAGR